MSTTAPNKPIPLRIIFILNGLMMILPFVFYFIFTTQDISIEGVNPTHFLYTGFAYIISFAFLVNFILKQQMIPFRIMFLVNILIALPAKAYIGIGVAILSILISLHSRVKAYFSA